MFHLLNCGLFWAIAWTGCAMDSISARTTRTRGWRRGRVAISTPTLAAGIKDTTLTRHPCIIFYYRYTFFRSFKAQLHYKCMRSGDCFVSPAAAAECELSSGPVYRRCEVAGEWKCRDGRCIEWGKVCDGYHHCQDKSAEEEGCLLDPEEGGGCPSLKVGFSVLRLVDHKFG